MNVSAIVKICLVMMFCTCSAYAERERDVIDKLSSETVNEEFRKTQFELDRIIRYSTSDTANPPTDAELDSAFGTPNKGFLAVLDDDGGGTAVYLIFSDGTSWFHQLMTKAV